MYTCLEQISSIVVENGCSPSVDLFPIIGKNMIVFPLLTLLLLFPMLMLLSLLLLSLLLSLLLLLFELEFDPRLAAREREEARKFKKVKVEIAPPVSQAGSPSTFSKSDSFNGWEICTDNNDIYLWIDGFDKDANDDVDSTSL